VSDGFDLKAAMANWKYARVGLFGITDSTFGGMTSAGFSVFSFFGLDDLETFFSGDGFLVFLVGDELEAFGFLVST